MKKNVRFTYSKFSKSILVFLILFGIIISLNIENIIKPRCNGRTIEYSILANFEEYLENEKNIDANTIFESLEDLKSKKLGTLSGTYYNKTIYNSVIEYDTYNQLFKDLRSFKIDGIIQPDRYAEDIKFFSDDLSLFPEHIQINKIGFGIQKNNLTLKSQINEFIKNNRDLHEFQISIWTRLNVGEKYIDTKLTGENGTLNVVARFINYPYAYKENDEIMGSEIEFLYLFAKEYGYKLNLKEVDTYEDQVESLINNSADITAGYFIIKGDKINEIDYTDFLYESKVYIIVRYSNLPESIEFKNPHDSLEKFNGDNIGLIYGSYYNDITKNFFPNSEIFLYKSHSEIYYHLLMKDIEGFIIDDVIAQYYKISFNNKLTYYPLGLGKDYICLGFQKNAKGEALLKEFNEFLKTLNLTKIYLKWYVYDTSKLTIDKELDKNNKLINVAINSEIKPLCFIEGNEIKGFETEIIYSFAKMKGYYIEITIINSAERLTFLEDGKADISGGLFTITEERKKTINFCNPLYSTELAFVVRTDNKKDEIQLKVLDNNYNEKFNNTADIQVKFSNSIKDEICIFPDKYSETFLIN